MNLRDEDGRLVQLEFNEGRLEMTVHGLRYNCEKDIWIDYLELGESKFDLAQLHLDKIVKELDRFECIYEQSGDLKRDLLRCVSAIGKR